MDPIITMARDLGKAIQSDERFINFSIASEANENDESLAELMNTFQEAQVSLREKTSKADKDLDEIKELDAKVRESYAAIFENKNVLALSKSQQELRLMLEHVSQIIEGSGQGLDPSSIEYEAPCPRSSCGGCSGC